MASSNQSGTLLPIFRLRALFCWLITRSRFARTSRNWNRAQKRAIIVISDGLDRGSKAKFNQALSVLQSLDIAVYCVQAQDRTRGAIRRDVPKPRQVIDDLAEGTGGRIFPIDDPGAAAKAICDELRRNRYVLSYLPQSVPYSESRRLLVMGDRGIEARAKTMQTAN